MYNYIVMWVSCLLNYLIKYNLEGYVMKSYKIINMEEFDRADYFQYFTSVGNTIEFTIKIDVTNAVQKCKQESISFYAYTLFKIYKVMNSIQNFRYDILDGNVIEWEKIIPTFTSFNKKVNYFLHCVKNRWKVILNLISNIKI